jgi:hypothetical protein
MLSEESFLLSCQEISTVNHITITPLFNKAMQTTCPDGVKCDDAFLLLIDATPYKKKATEVLSVSYHKLIHVTSVAHAFYSV